MSDILTSHKKIWENKKIIRLIYSEWYKKIIHDLVSCGKTLELGGGSGNFKEFKPDVISSDIDPKPWLDMIFDAHKMPFENNAIQNIVMIDVLHHLSNPVLFLEEAYRVLNKKGKIIILEPFPTMFSLMVYKLFHPEPFIFNMDYYSLKTIHDKHPWESNQAISYLLFFKHRKQFEETFKSKFRIVKKEKMSFILYPLSGGFENKSLIPNWLIPTFQFIEKYLFPLKRFLAFRTYIVLEKI